jgi:hypothetical protein
MWMNLLIDSGAAEIVIPEGIERGVRRLRARGSEPAEEDAGIAPEAGQGSILVVMPSTLFLDGMRFAMVSSTASEVDSDAPTTFDYHQDGRLIWGEYTGDTVTEGRFVGEIAGAEVRVSFAHALVSDGSVVRGDAVSRAEQEDDGRIRLIEDFAVDGIDHVSVCLQV